MRVKFCENHFRSMKYALAPVDITKNRNLVQHGKSTSGGYQVYSGRNRDGVGCLEVVQMHYATIRC